MPMIDLIEILFIVAVIIVFIYLAIGYSIPNDVMGDEEDRDE
jgi:hypothetical protein